MHEDLILDVIAVVMSLLFVASLISILSKKTRFPYTIFLVIIGLLMGWASQSIPLLEHLTLIKLTPEVILFVFLPVLLFESAFNLDVRALLKNLLPIMTLAVPALLISTGIVGFIIHAVLSVPLDVAFLFGALISATDPVAVISLFKGIGAPKRLNLLVEGESLSNDGTALVAFKILLGVVLSGTLSLGTLFHGVIEFFVVFFGGVGVGILLGFFFSKIIEYVENDRLVEITLTTILAHTTFISAEHFFHVSGVMATVAAGLTMGSYGRNKVSPPVLQHMESFWEYFAFVCNSLIFLLVGFSVNLELFIGNYHAMFLAALAAMAARGMAVYSLFPLIDRLKMVEKVDIRFQTVIFWGGLRGALAIAMALSIPDELSYKPFILVLTLGVVLFTIIVNGLTIKPLMAALGLEKYSLKEQFERVQAVLLAKKKAMEKMSSFSDKELIHEKIVKRAEEEYRKEVDALNVELGGFRKGEHAFGIKEESEVIERHALTIERREYQKLFEEGFLREDSLNEMCFTIDNQLDRIKEGRPILGAGKRPFTFTQAEERLLNAVKNVFFLQPFVREYKTRKIAASYERKRARLMVAVSVLQELESMEIRQTYSPQLLQEMKEFYNNILKTTIRRIDAINREFPEYMEKVEAGLLKRFCLNQELETYRGLYRQGGISDKILIEMEESLERTLRSMKARPVEELLIPPVKLIGLVPCFQEIQEESLKRLTTGLKALSYFPGDEIVREGEEGSSLFVMGRGRVDVIGKDENGKEIILKNLQAGDFFGEAALLHPQRRTATVRAVTPCTLLELSREKFQGFMETDPYLKDALEEVYRTRVVSTFLSRIPLFQNLENEDREKIVSLLEMKDMGKGEIIAEEGKPASSLYIIKSGEAETVKRGKVTGVLKTGDWFGDRAFLENEPYEATLKGLANVVVYCLNAKQLKSLKNI